MRANSFARIARHSIVTIQSSTPISRSRRNAPGFRPPPDPVEGTRRLARSRTIIVAGAGIGGLSAALALARAGFRVVILEQAMRREEAGAGIQLSPNATHVLRGLGVLHLLRPYTVAPDAIRLIRAKSGRDIVRIPLGAAAEQRYGAPYWVIHRADLQRGLTRAIEQSADIMLQLGARAEDFAIHPHGVTVQVRTAQGLRTCT